MKEIRTLHYITSGIILLMILEGLFTMGQAFRFDTYNWFGWFTQIVFILFTVLTAMRIANEVEGK
jgi:hypothetical protein